MRTTSAPRCAATALQASASSSDSNVWRADRTWMSAQSRRRVAAHGDVVCEQAGHGDALRHRTHGNREYRRYQRTGSRMTSGRNRNPANAERARRGGLDRRLRLTQPPSPSRGDPSMQQRRSDGTDTPMSRRSVFVQSW